MCVFCLEPLWHVPAPSSSRGPGGIGGGQRRVTRQDVPGKDSPNRHSKVRLVIAVSHSFICHLLCLVVSDFCPRVSAGGDSVL